MSSNEPYVGLRPFHQSEWDRFFGRDTETLTIVDVWQIHRVIVVYGPSGVGKTSLLCAGVLRRCEDAGAHVLPVARVTTAVPIPAYRWDEYNPYAASLLAAWTPDETEPDASGVTVTDFLRKRFAGAGTSAGKAGTGTDDTRPILAVVDQFEEFLHDIPHRRPFRGGFLRQLGEALDEFPTLRLLLSVREEFFAGVLQLEAELGHPIGGHFAVPPLDRAAALEAVVGPLRSSWRSFAPGAAERLVDGLLADRVAESQGGRAARSTQGETLTTASDTAAVEPTTLQVVCTSMWETLPDSVLAITVGHVEEFGDVDRSLTDYCRRAVAEVAAQEGLAEHDLWQWLVDRFVTDLGTRGRVYEGVSTTGLMPSSVAHALERRHVLRSELRARTRWFELAHDRLIDPVRRSAASWLADESGRSHTSTAQFLRLADSALASDRLDLAAHYAREAMRLDDLSPDLRARAEAEAFLGRLMLGDGDEAAAEAHLRSAAWLFGSLSDTTAVGRVMSDIGRLRLDQGRYAEAIDEFGVAMTHAPGDLDIKLECARAYWMFGQAHAAVATLGSILTVSPGHVGALALRGVILVAQGDARAGTDDLDRAAQLDPSVTARSDVVEARRRAGEAGAS